MAEFFPLNKKDFEQIDTGEFAVTGFQSPSADYIDNGLKLAEKLIEHEQSTYFGRVEGDSMKEAGLLPNDIIIVDRSVDPKTNDVIVGVLDNIFIIRYFSYLHGRRALIASNKKYIPVLLTEDTVFEVWGTVMASLTLLRK